MSQLQPPRGTYDILPDEARRRRHLVETFRGVAERYGYGEIATPVFEFSEVFHRTLGETSDVVSKETYSFEDRGGEGLTLRPEYTAGIVRAFISNGLTQTLPCKFYAHGPMFRYERPQKGRFRQFHQIDLELLGVPEPQGDVEVIALAADLLDRLGILDKTVLELNSLGDAESRAAYRTALVEYFTAHKAGLSEDSLKRLDKNPMRILDSKDEGDRKLVADAPLLQDYLNPASQAFFADVLDGLNLLGISYQINPRLVRGLDYYSHTAFEFTTDQLGAQSAVLAGGRYDTLVQTMGGPATAGIGWAAGMERLSLLMGDIPAAARPIAIVPIGAGTEKVATTAAHTLRRAGHVVELAFRGNVGKRMKRADKLNARLVIFLGEDELANNLVKLRDLDSGAENDVPYDELVARLESYR